MGQRKHELLAAVDRIYFKDGDLRMDRKMLVSQAHLSVGIIYFIYQPSASTEMPHWDTLTSVQ